MRNDNRGCSTCPPGEEHFELFSTLRNQDSIQYDFRTADGEPFSTVARTLETCRQRRDHWLAERAAKAAEVR